MKYQKLKIGDEWLSSLNEVTTRNFSDEKQNFEANSAGLVDYLLFSALSGVENTKFLKYSSLKKVGILNLNIHNEPIIRK